MPYFVRDFVSCMDTCDPTVPPPLLASIRFGLRAHIKHSNALPGQPSHDLITYIVSSSCVVYVWVCVWEGGVKIPVKARAGFQGWRIVLKCEVRWGSRFGYCDAFVCGSRVHMCICMRVSISAHPDLYAFV